MTRKALSGSVFWGEIKNLRGDHYWDYDGCKVIFVVMFSGGCWILYLQGAAS